MYIYYNRNETETKSILEICLDFRNFQAVILRRKYRNKVSALIISAQLADSDPKKKKKEKKRKFYSKLYTKFLFVPLFLCSEDGSYFTILCLFITVKQNWAESQKKTPGGILKRKAQITVSCRDLGLMS